MSRCGAIRLFTAFAMLLSGSLATPAVAQDVVLQGGTVIDVRTGTTRRASVLIRNGVIESVSPALAVPEEAAVIDVSGRWVVPGLVEMHTHATGRDVLRRALGLGVTSTLTIYTGMDSIPPALEGASHLPDAPMPRTYLVGGRFRAEDWIPGRPRSPSLYAPATPTDATRYLDVLRAQGVTRIKIWSDDGTVQRETPIENLDDAVVGALVDGARARGMDVYVHALTGRLYRATVAHGPTWIIHPMVTDRLTEEDVAAIKAAGLGWTTVMSIVMWRGDPQRYARLALSDPRLVSSLSAEARDDYRRISQLIDNPNEANAPRIVERVDTYLDNIRRNTHLAVARGLVVAVGSDRPAGYGTHLEIELLRDAGLDAQTILRAATLGGAQALGVDDSFGTIEPRKVADVVVLTSNPLAEVTNLRDVEYVVKGGRVWSAVELRGR